MSARSKRLVVSLFCGVGGLDLEFQSAGFEIAVVIDNNPKVLELYRLNFPDTTVLCRDIGEISASEIREVIQQKYPDWNGEITTVIGDPPCQGFSVAGKQDVNDERSQLVIKFINLVVELNPSMFVMENVPAIESKKFSHITANAWSLAEEQYILSKWLLTASDYGVPQKRQRAIWVGSKFGKVAIPFESNHKFNVGDAISDLRHIPINPQTDSWELDKKGEYAQYLDKIFPPKSGLLESTITGCKATVHNSATQRKYGNTIPGEKEPTTWAYRLSESGFSRTLRAGSGNRTAARPIHYEYPRVITVREAARLHSFPDWFYLGQTKLDAHKAIGNSVPPLLAYAIASQIWMHLEKQQSPTIISQPQLYLLELQTVEILAGNFRIIHSTTQQLKNINYSTSVVFGANNIRTDNTRSPPIEIENFF